MAADVWIPVRPPGIDKCPGAGLGRLDQVLAWTGSPSSALQAWALAQLRYPLGTIIRDTVEGVPVVARIECHFAYGANPSAPGQWHKGTSVYRPATRTPSGALAPMTAPTAGWPSAAAALT